MTCYNIYSYILPTWREIRMCVKNVTRVIKGWLMAKREDGFPSKTKSIFIPRAIVSSSYAPGRRDTAEIKKPCGFGIFASLSLWKTDFLHIHNDDEDSGCGFRFAKLKGYEFVWIDFFSLLLTV